MKLLVSTGLLLLGRAEAQITCYQCTATFDSFIDDVDNCWTPGAGTTTTPTCTATASTPHTAPQCNQKITFEDGYPKAITRECGNEFTPGTETNVLETQNAQTCDLVINESRAWFAGVSVGSSSTYGTSSCQTDCNTANCNTAYSLLNLKVCDNTKVGPADVLTKWCDFETGIWYCRSVGTDFGTNVVATDNIACTAPITPAPVPVAAVFAPISCVQCNSETDADCWTRSVATTCELNSYVSCTAETVITYGRFTGDRLREVVVRGCSTMPATYGVGTPVFDQCHWTSAFEDVDSNYQSEKAAKDNRWANEIQLACVSTCDPTNNNAACNVVPNGMQDTTQEKLIRCVSFMYDASNTANMAAAQMSTHSTFEVCDPGVTQCYSEVTYLDRNHQDYIPDALAQAYETQILTHKRGCGPITASGCVQEAWTASTMVSTLDVKKYTCAETCMGDLCNNENWPNRPKCYMTGMTDHPHACASPHHAACSVMEKNLISAGGKYKEFVEDHVVGTGGVSSWSQDLGFSTSVMRGCVHNVNQIPTGCHKVAERPVDGHRFNNELFVEDCNMTCAVTGCNFGTGYSGSFVQGLSVMALVVALVVERIF